MITADFIHLNIFAHVIFRLVGRAQRSYNINVNASKVTYVTSENNVKIYMEAANTNGIQKGGKTYNQVREFMLKLL